MDDTTRERLVDGSIWLRGLHMIIFLIAYNIAEIIIVILAIFQFLCALITGSTNEPLLRLGKNLSVYAEDIFEFLTFNSEYRPFPFDPWPDEQVTAESWRGNDDSPAADTSDDQPDSSDDAGKKD